MKTIVLNSFLEIKEFHVNAVTNNGVFYRGTKFDHILPSLIPKNNYLNNIQLANVENKLLDEFKIFYSESIDEEPILQDWIYRIKAREHELASRLIDWSNDFKVALNFATSNVSHNSANLYVYLWSLQIEPIDFLHLKEYPFNQLTKSIFIPATMPARLSYLMASHRQFIQGGNFLVQPTAQFTIPLNTQSEFIDKLTCIKIPIAAVDDIRNDMLKSGEDIRKPLMINEHNILDKICKWLNQKYLYSLNDFLNLK